MTRLLTIASLTLAIDVQSMPNRLTYYEDVKPLLMQSVPRATLTAASHPFPLMTFEEVFESRALVANSILGNDAPVATRQRMQ